MDTFLELAMILGIAVIVGLIMRLLKQPLIIGHIFTGILVSPHVFGIVESGDTIDTFAHVGVTLLLFLVGLNLNPHAIKETGKASVITGIGQILFTSIFGFLIAYGIGFDLISSAYLAIALTFSSTIIISKILSDKGDLQSLYGRIAIGFLIVQDLIAIAVLVLIAGSPETLFRDIFIVLGIGIFAWIILPRIMGFIARSQELLLIFSLAWCMIFAALFKYIGLSIEAGALLAGMGLSLSHFRHEIGARLRPIRDFFLLLFFVMLSTQMVFVDFPVTAAIILSLFVLIGNPLIVIVLLGRLGYAAKTSFQAGLTVAQISEFSLIMVSLGVTLGHIPTSLLSLTTIIGILTIAGSTYMILYSDKLFTLIEPLLKFLKGEENMKRAKHYDIILFGCNRIGKNLLEDLSRKKKKFFIVDYNPEVVVDLSHKGFEAHYGDASDPELLESLNLKKPKMFISTIRDLDANLVILSTLKRYQENPLFSAIAESQEDALILYEAGASYVLIPHELGGKQMSLLLNRHGLDPMRYLEEKIMHLEHLRKE